MTNTSTVTLGEFEFDPLEPTDFRLTVEGASNTGKSNTLAVILEDLAETHVPTLIIERLGILSPVRKLDEQLIVVGARDEQGIDLAVPLDQLDLVAEMVLERGLKVLLDISTYADADPDAHTEHLATARVLGALDRRATERLRAGSRRKCLLFVDEVHYLAPESGAPHIDADDYVKRARGQLVTVFTEGGNKGIIPTVTYQRQAYTSKGVVSQADNRIIHRLHATDRKSTASDLGIDAEEIEALGTGDVLAYGDMTRQRVIGPEHVRQRESPDPREESFELPEPPDQLSETLASIGEEVEQREAEQTEREDRIDELESEIERLRERNEELAEDREFGERIAAALERIQSGEAGDGEASAELAGEIEDLRERNERLQETLDEREREVESLREQLSERNEDVERLKGELAELEEFEAIRDELAADARSILRLLGEADPESEEARGRINELQAEKRELREQVEDLEERAEELEADLDAARAADGESEAVTTVESSTEAGTETGARTGMLGPASLADAGLTALLQHEAIQTAVQTAADRGTAADQHYGRVLSVLASAGTGQYRSAADVAALLDVSDATVREVLKGLHTANVVMREAQGRGHAYALDRNLLEQRIDVAEQQAAIVGDSRGTEGGKGR